MNNSTSLARKHPPKFLIDKILPLDEINLLSGGSGTNKTTLISYILQRWSRGEQVFGFDSYPAPWVYISLDRSLSETEDRLISSGLDLSNAAFYSLDEKETILLSDFDCLIKPEHRLIIIESVVRLMSAKENQNDLSSTSRVLARLKKWTRKDHRSLLFTSWDSKARTTEGTFENARERVAGSVAWGGMSSTVLNMARNGPDNRILTVSSRYCQEFNKYFKIDEEGGNLIETASPEEQGSDAFTQTLLDTPIGKSLPLEVVRAIAEQFKIAERTWKRKMSELIQNGSFINEAEVGFPGSYKRIKNDPS